MVAGRESTATIVRRNLGTYLLSGDVLIGNIMRLRWMRFLLDIGRIKHNCFKVAIIGVLLL